MSETDIHVAKHTFHYPGGMISEGTTVRIGHPLQVKYPDSFEPLTIDLDYVPEIKGRHASSTKTASK